MRMPILPMIMIDLHDDMNPNPFNNKILLERIPPTFKPAKQLHEFMSLILLHPVSVQSMPC